MGSTTSSRESAGTGRRRGETAGNGGGGGGAVLAFLDALDSGSGASRCARASASASNAAIARSGFRGMHCDRDVWRGADGFGTFAVIFYVSKYYEFVDSWILVLKNSDGKHAPSFLQKYHHAGIVVCMYAAVVSEANWMLIAVTFNCTIHFFMYSSRGRAGNVSTPARDGDVSVFEQRRAASGTTRRRRSATSRRSRSC